jgi:hypothetical protein
MLNIFVNKNCRSICAIFKIVILWYVFLSFNISVTFSVSLLGLLENVLQKQKHSVTATPPPSPTHGQPNSTSPVHTGE